MHGALVARWPQGQEWWGIDRCGRTDYYFDIAHLFTVLLVKKSRRVPLGVSGLATGGGSGPLINDLSCCSQVHRWQSTGMCPWATLRRSTGLSLGLLCCFFHWPHGQVCECALLGVSDVLPVYKSCFHPSQTVMEAPGRSLTSRLMSESCPIFSFLDKILL